MIKFRYAIHKETGLVLTYNRWLQHFNEARNKDIILNNKTVKSPYESEDNIMEVSQLEFSYGITDILTSDDFEIIYESEFTREELDQLRYMCFEVSNASIYMDFLVKLKKIYTKEWELENKYGIRE